MKLNEALQLIKGLGYTVWKTKRISRLRKSYLIHAIHSDNEYRFMLDRGKLYKEIPLRSGGEFWAELEEIR